MDKLNQESFEFMYLFPHDVGLNTIKNEDLYQGNEWRFSKYFSDLHFCCSDIDVNIASFLIKNIRENE